MRPAEVYIRGNRGPRFATDFATDIPADLHREQQPLECYENVIPGCGRRGDNPIPHAPMGRHTDLPIDLDRDIDGVSRSAERSVARSAANSGLNVFGGLWGGWPEGL